MYGLGGLDHVVVHRVQELGIGLYYYFMDEQYFLNWLSSLLFDPRLYIFQEKGLIFTLAIYVNNLYAYS
jgi:hypothetical protein